ncbi:MAG: F0F1 ATP synthase subunit epsilon [Terriglobia bacterium]
MDTTLPTALELQVVTPERLVVSESASAVSLPGKSGRLGILPGHAPLVSELAAGVISYRREGTTKRLAVSNGFTEVLPARVIVLAQAAERAEEIDVERARTTRHQAEERLKSLPDTGENSERSLAQAALERATAWLEAATETSGTGM